MQIIKLGNGYDAEINEFVNENAYMNIEIIERPITPHPAELSLPPAIILGAAAIFFKGFLDEAGKDAYKKLKQSVAKFLTKISQKYDGSNKRYEMRNLEFHYSLNYILLKFIFYNSFTEDIRAKAVEELFAMIHPNNETELLKRIAEFQSNIIYPAQEMYLEYIVDRNRWEFHK